MSDTHEHLEHAEHDEHAAHNPYDKRVALTIAVVAAALAAVTLLSHRAHNDTLQFQIESDIHQTKASDAWNEYQTNNIRRHEYAAFAQIIDVVSPVDKSAKANAMRDDWNSKVNKYDEKMETLQAKANDLERQSTEAQAQSHFAHDKSSRYDLGELAVELGLVLCSVAILTKKREFWYSGMAAAVIGVIVASTVLFLSPHEAEHRHTETSTQSHDSGKGY